MSNQSPNPSQSQTPRQNFDASSPLSIYEYSRHLIGRSLRSYRKESDKTEYKGKGAVGQMVEEIFFGYEINSNREADFKSAGVELKCTPLKKNRDEKYAIKERLVCSMIDYFEIVNTKFEDSHLLDKCGLMLILYYLFISGQNKWDYEFIFRILWQLPQKDLIQLKQDYDTIAEKVRRGEAHLLSEGDTLYLGACRKGQKGDKLQKQPNSTIGAPKRAFSLKPSYQRYILGHVVNSSGTGFTNYIPRPDEEFQLVTEHELRENSFEDIIKFRFSQFIELDYNQICSKLDRTPVASKSKYARAAWLIATGNRDTQINRSEEFLKSGTTMKTIRLTANGTPEESMSFHNIKYFEIMENDVWEDSDLYELFTTRFMFVVFQEVKGAKISVVNSKTGAVASEKSYILTGVYFWTMPQEDLICAKDYWDNIRRNVVANNINAESFWRLTDRRKFHVRPKGTKENGYTENPHGGECRKYCYWLNAEYVKSIIDKLRDDI